MSGTSVSAYRTWKSTGSILSMQVVHEALHKVTLEVTRPRDRELRFADFAEVGGGVLKFVYAMRGQIVRCISFRSASRLERKVFYEIRNR